MMVTEVYTNFLTLPIIVIVVTIFIVMKGMMIIKSIINQSAQNNEGGKENA